jgi:2-C-methyl-D-erythritol 2,4-cyclodiphosphate synthase
LRVGIGYDVHRLVAGRPLLLGGVSIPFELGLEGHSDADVLTHAVIDALLGAAGLGNIGQHFPDSDERYRGASSLDLLSSSRELLGIYSVVNVDAVVIAQAPRLQPHLEAMAQNLARGLGVEPEQVSVKATSPEGVGALGRGEGIAAQAVALLE